MLRALKYGKQVIRPVLGIRYNHPVQWNTRTSSLLLANQKYAAVVPQIRSIHNSSSLDEQEKERQKWSMIMSDDQKKQKKDHIQKMQEEEVPTTLVAKVKYYFKRYWYIAVPAHMVCCSAYFGAFYAMVYCGVDVISLLQTLHIPDLLVEKIRNTPPSAGAFVVALILYKIATPLRYITTLGLIQATFWGLRRVGKLRTAREVEYKVRDKYEENVKKYGRRLYRSRNKGVREIARQNSDANAHKESLNVTKKVEQQKKGDRP